MTGITACYLIYRFAVFGSIGGYGNSIIVSPGDTEYWLSLLKTIMVIIPANIILPYPWETPSVPEKLKILGACLFWSLMIFPALLSRKHRKPVMEGVFYIFLFLAPVIPVIRQQIGHPVAPRYLLTSSFWLCLTATGIITLFKNRKLQILLFAFPILAWTPILMLNQYTIYTAGRVSEAILNDLQNYCDPLSDDTQIIVTGIPGKIGAINVEHPHAYFTVFNLETLHRCGLLPSFQPCRDMTAEGLDAYLRSAPGVVSTVSRDDPAILLETPLRSRQIVLTFENDPRLPSEIRLNDLDKH